MSRKISNLLDYGLEEEIDPKIKFNSLLSVTVSTIMCLAAGCPLPKSNVETTKLFLSKITDDSGQTPRNVKGFLSLLNNYNGPYENDSFKERCFEKPILEDKSSFEIMSEVKVSTPPPILPKESCHSTDSQTLTKRSSKLAVRKGERDITKKGTKSIGSKISVSKSIITTKF